LILPDPKKSDSLSSYIRLELQYPSDVDGVAILNGFVDYAIAAEREQVGADLKVIVNNRLNELKGKIDAARANYDTDKESKIAKLLEDDRLKRAQLQDELSALRLQMKMERTNRRGRAARKPLPSPSPWVSKRRPRHRPWRMPHEAVRAR